MASGFSEERPNKLRKLTDTRDEDREDYRPDDAINEQHPVSAPALKNPSSSTTEIKDPATTLQEEIPVPGLTNDEVGMGNNDNGGYVVPKLSKNQLKKLRKKEEWEAGRGDRKIARKEKQKARRIAKREERDALAAEAGNEDQRSPASDLPDGAARVTTKQPRPVHVPVTIVIDCSWNDLMMEKELISLGGQLTRCYSDNQKAKFRAHMVVSSFGGVLKERFETVLERQYLGWKGVRFLEGDFVDASRDAKEWMKPEAKGGFLRGQFSRYEGQEEKMQEEAEVIYLSSDADETLQELKPYSTYIIGGLVDKNRYKAICHKRAGERGIKTAKLPIGDYMQMASRKVLTVNHVNEIMLKWLELGDWGKAFDGVIPKRKGGVLKDASTEEAEAERERATEDDEEPTTERPVQDGADERGDIAANGDDDDLKATSVQSLG